MKKSIKLQSVTKVNKQQERNAGRRHGESIRQAEQQQRQLDELVDYRNHYLKAFQTASEAGLSVVRMQEYKLFINRLADAIAQQKQHVKHEQEKCKTSKKEWVQKRSKCKIIDKVVEKRKQVEQQEMKKREQKELESLPHKTYSNL